MNIKKTSLFIATLGIFNISFAENIIRVTAPIKEAISASPGATAEPEQPLTYSSCLEIKNKKPASPSGVYTIHQNDREFPAYCDMTSDGGGWTMIVAQYEHDPVTNWNEGMQQDYDPSLISTKGFALSSSEVPSHTQVGFGKDLEATASDFVNFSYTNGNIGISPVTGLKTGDRYNIYRNNANYYDNHRVGNGMGYSAQWSNTLTFDKVSKTYNWAFSPNTNIAGRGYSFNADRQSVRDNFAWTVWVR